MVKQNIIVCQTESVASVYGLALSMKYSQNIQLGMTLHFPILCSAHGSFRRLATRETLAKTTCSFFEA